SAGAASRGSRDERGHSRQSRVRVGQRHQRRAPGQRSRPVATCPAAVAPRLGARAVCRAGRGAGSCRPAAGNPARRRGAARMGWRGATCSAENPGWPAAGQRPLASAAGGGMSTLWAFPGQGAQQPGMLHGLPEAPVVQACIKQASIALDEDVRLLDSTEALRSTRAVQLCLLIAGVAAARLLLERGHRPDYVAGLSIGAYAAAVVAEALNFADAVRLVALRGELMQRAYPRGYGMTAILGLDQTSVERLLAEAEGRVYLANINAETQLVIAGSDAAMAQVVERARALGAG